MIPVEATQAICGFLKKELSNLRPLASTGNERAVSVYMFHLPEPSGTPMAVGGYTAEDLDGMMPAVVVCPVLFEDKAFSDGSAALTVSIMAGVYSDESTNTGGPWAVINILERARMALLAVRVIDERYELQEPLSWELYPDTNKPAWSGEMITQLRMASPVRIDAHDWRGDRLTVKE